MLFCTHLIHTNLHPWPRAGLTQLNSYQPIPCPVFQEASTLAPEAENQIFSYNPSLQNNTQWQLTSQNTWVSNLQTTNTSKQNTLCQLLTSNTIFIILTETIYFYLEKMTLVTVTTVTVNWTHHCPQQSQGQWGIQKLTVRPRHVIRDFIFTDTKKKEQLKLGLQRKERTVGKRHLWTCFWVSFSFRHTLLPLTRLQLKKKKKARQEIGERKLKKKSTHPSPISSPLSPKELCLSVQT